MADSKTIAYAAPPGAMAVRRQQTVIHARCKWWLDRRERMNPVGERLVAKCAFATYLDRQLDVMYLCRFDGDGRLSLDAYGAARFPLWNQSAPQQLLEPAEVVR